VITEISIMNFRQTIPRSCQHMAASRPPLTAESALPSASTASLLHSDHCGSRP